MKCPRCQQENPPQAKFCLACGAPVGVVAVTGRSHADLRAEIESLKRSLSEASEQQTATSEILRVISSSPTDTQPVFETIAATALRLCNAKLCTVFRFDGKLIHLVALHQVSTEGAAAYRDAYPAPPGRAGGTHRAILTRSIVHIHDIREDPEYELQALARANDFGCVLSVPMLRDGQPVGAITVGREAGRSFSDEQIALLKTFASQALIAIENVRLFNETEEALDQQTATAEILRVISSSPTNVKPVFDAILASATTLCDAHIGLLGLYDGTHYRQVAHLGVPPEFEKFAFGEWRPQDRLTEQFTGVGRMIATRAPVHIVDLMDEPLYREGNPTRVATVKLGRARTFLAVPMLRDDRLVGGIVIYRPEVRPFSENQIALLKTFADQALIAIENVRLFTELQEKNHALTQAHAQVSETLEQQTATSEILRLIAGSPTDLESVLGTVAETAMRVCGARDAIIYRCDGDVLRLACTRGLLPVRPSSLALPLNEKTVTGRSVVERRTIHVHDLAAVAASEYPEALSRGVAGGSRTVLATPLLQDGQPLGAILIRRGEVQAFTDKQIALLETFADQAVIAIENVRLFSELQTSNRDLRAALETQTATSDILRVISRSQTDVQPVFDAIVASAVRLLGADSGLLTRIAGDQIEIAALTSTDPAGDAILRAAYPLSRHSDRVHARVIRDRAPLNVADAQTDPRLPDVQHATARARGYRSHVAVPLLRHDEALGAIAVTRHAPGGFTDDEIALLQTFADQAVIAIENARLLNELQERNEALTHAHAQVTEALEQQTATSEILTVISRSPNDVRPVLDAIAEHSVRLCGALFSSVYRFDGELIHMDAHFNYPAVALERSKAFFPTPPHRRLFTARAILEHAVVHVPDVREDSEFIGAELVDQAGFRAVLSVPMLRDGAPLGAITVWHADVGAFSGKQIELLKTFADQAVIAIENVRLFNELQEKNRALTAAHAQVSEALEQQTATSEILRVISSSPTDMQPVFEAILEKATRLCDAQLGMLALVEGGSYQFVVERGATPAYHDWLFEGPRAINPETGMGRALLTGRPVHIIDIRDEAIYRQGNPHRVATADLAGARTCLWVPMLKEAQTIGGVVIYRREVRAFTEKQIDLVKTFADQAVIAIENVRLFKELEARTQDLTRSVGELRALGEVGQAISSTLDLQTVLSTIVARATQLSGTDAGVIYEYDAQREVFLPRATEHLEAEIVETMLATPVRKGEGATGRLAEVQEAIQVPDILAAPAESRVRGVLVRAGYRALLAAPLVREEQLIGALTVIRKATGEFLPEVIDLLRTFATQSALAIQNARLFREIADKSRQLEVASQHKSEFLANMSHELRTPLNAIIGFSEVLSERMFGELNEKQEEYLKDIHASGQHLLSLINDILDLSKIEAGRMELEVTDFDLPLAIDNALMLVRERAGRRSIALHTTVDERLGQIQADERKIRQVVLNLLSNAIKFTPEGGRIEVAAKPVNGSIEVSVTDTGVGIAPEDQEAVFEEFRQVGMADKKVEGTGLGLALSRKFIELHGGKIWVKSQLGAGSTFTFTVPVRR